MGWDDLKYLLAYVGPASAYFSVAAGGTWSYSSVVLAFVIIPVVELFVGSKGGNTSAELVPLRSRQIFFDLLLYLNVPIIYGLVYFYLSTVTSQPLHSLELLGMTLSVGIFVGATGINVAHELGHRRNRWERLLSIVLLVPAFYQHFYVEHNRGHHRYVCTPGDPATARYGESLYRFWWRSTIGSYLSAWNIEKKLLAKQNHPVWSMRNQMLQFAVIQILYMIVIAFLFRVNGLLLAISIGVIGFLQLESINYIEHYGLIRSKRPDGGYEKVGMQHSWNSNHDLGRIFLYELTRHADHHYKASKKYQVLNHVDESPQLPTGYPGSILLALFPFLWFKVINKRIPADMLPIDGGG
ncbi:MAG: alkane 1-monooxygenase [Saprospiraceae bacterium]|nr:alkane 1-monooxygenase [Saprospiraceae bacterium]